MEVIVAMIVLLVVFGLAMTIFTNVSRSTLSGQKVRAAALANDLMIQAEARHNFSATTFKQGTWRIETSIKPLADNPALSEFDIAVFDDVDQQIALMKKVIQPGP
ncbi:hypothetical protein C8P68_11242 [Mucilaginibacter yixingensis]|uniref:Type II secretory pathway pseudopilin PulG n=2 Tax=Mucilaginibacter yixingensis TaxID=1295612 RepID=A0A2T5J4L5_9SPHI|nr:hypothetical protein C8P68_11242 [Mucilaginibacter yixingensis]